MKKNGKRRAPKEGTNEERNPVSGHEYSSARGDSLSSPSLPKRGRGQPTKLTAELQTRIAQLLRAGNYLETAAQACGVAAVTARAWLREGAADVDAGRKTRYAAFNEAVLKANAEAEARFALNISAAGVKDWRAAAFMLERKFPKRWSQRIETTPVDAPPNPLDGRSEADLQHFVTHGVWPEDAA